MQFLCAISKIVLLTYFSGHCHILVGCACHIDFNTGLMIHDIKAFGIVLEAVCPEQNVQSVPAGAVFGVAVHQRNDLCGDPGVVTAVRYAVVQINGANPIEDTKADTIVTFCLYCDIEGHEAVWIIAFGSKPGIRLIRNFCFPSVSFFIPPTAEQTVFS